MIEKRGVALTTIDKFPATTTNRLAELWITTAEELVSAARRVNGPQGLATFLAMSIGDVIALVNQALAILPPDVSFAPEDVIDYGLGALDLRGDLSDSIAATPVWFEPLPAKMNLTTRMSPVRNQGQRSTCVAFTCVAIREFWLGQQGDSEDLSEQHLYWNCKQHDNYKGTGTYIQTAMERLQADGVCSERVWPYNPQIYPASEGQGPSPANAAQQGLQYRIDSWQEIGARQVETIRQFLTQEQPVAFAVPVYEYWGALPLRETGDIRLPLSTDPNRGGHAMCIVGYEDDLTVPGGGFFLVRNSWGATWANTSFLAPGYARLPYMYVAQYGQAAYVPKISIQPTVLRQDIKQTSPENRWQRLWRHLFG